MTLLSLTGRVETLIPVKGESDACAVRFDLVTHHGTYPCCATGKAAACLESIDLEGAPQSRLTVIGQHGHSKSWARNAIHVRSVHVSNSEFEAMPATARSVLAKRRISKRKQAFSAPLPTPDIGPILSAMGEATAWRYKMLKTAHERIGDATHPRGWCTVNRRGFPPFAPHGQSLVDDGFMTAHRSGGPRSKTTTLAITQEGCVELARLEKRVAKLRKRHGLPT